MKQAHTFRRRAGENETRQRIHTLRGASEMMSDMARRLPPAERAIMEQVFSRGMSVADIALLTGTPASTLRNRLRRLIARVRSPLYVFLDAQADLLPHDVRRTAEVMVFQGKSMRRAARDLGVSLHHVRQHVRHLRAMARV